MKKYFLPILAAALLLMTACNGPNDTTDTRTTPTPRPSENNPLTTTPETTAPQTPSTPSQNQNAPTTIDTTNWQSYKNSVFSARLPDSVRGTNLCQNPPQGKEALVPVKGFNAPNNIFFIGTAYHYEDNASKDCAKIEHSEHFFSQSKPKDNLYWTIHAKSNVANDGDLSKFIQERYGKDCKLGQKKGFDQKDVSQYSIQRNDAVQSGQCTLNGKEVLLYYPLKKIAVTFGKAQATTFTGADGKGYDDEIVKTLRFNE